MAWTMGCFLSDGSQLVLDFQYLSQNIRDKGPSELKGWRVLDTSGRLLPKVSLYEPPGSPNKNNEAP